ncbi:T9SS type B sorting domain-containing protein [Indibacter alkaliphilus]|nr:gliding motility-associated C-terminal domain-containing protein [Indibacter alkaliphilus]
MKKLLFKTFNTIFSIRFILKMSSFNSVLVLFFYFLMINVFHLQAQSTIYVDKNNNSEGIKEVTLIIDRGGANEQRIVQTSQTNENPSPGNVPVEIESILLENGERIFATSRFPVVKSANTLLGSDLSPADVRVIKYNHTERSQHISHANNLQNFLRAMEEVVSVPDLRSYWDISPTPIFEENNAFVDIIYPNQIPSSGYMLISERNGNSGMDLLPLDADGNVIQNASLVTVMPEYTWNTGVNHQIDLPEQKQWLTIINAGIFNTTTPIHGFRVFDIMEADGKFVFFAREVSAVPDNAGPVFGFSGGNNIINIFDNDELDGRPLDPEDIELVVFDIEGSLASGFIILNQDPNSQGFGNVSVAAGTPAGVYTFEYEITDKLDGRKDRTTVTIRVTDPVDPEFEDCRGSDFLACNGNEFSYGSIFLSDQTGNKIEGESCEFGTSSEVYISVAFNSAFENTRFETRLLADLYIGQSNTPVKISAFLGTLDAGVQESVIRVISEKFIWNCGDELSLKNVLLLWRAEDDLTDAATCEDYNSEFTECSEAINIQTPTVDNESCIDAARISGKVIHEITGEPISGVPVLLISQGGKDDLVYVAVTASDGRYIFDEIVFGEYLVQVNEANLNAVKGLFASGESSFTVVVDACINQVEDFNYGPSNDLYLGGIVWYDANGNGVQDEWYDANDDGKVTLNDPTKGAIDINEWEWFDLNGDGRYDGPENFGELNIAGFGNAKSTNIKVVGPNGFERGSYIGKTGYWSELIEQSDAFGEYSAQLIMDRNLNDQASAKGESGLIKTLPNLRTEFLDSNIRFAIECGLTTPEFVERTLSRSKTRHNDLHFGIRCHEGFVEIIANDDDLGEHFISYVGPLGNILENDLLNGKPVTPDLVDFEFTELDGLIGLSIEENGDLSLLIPEINAPRTYTLRYTLREVGYPDNFDEATVTLILVSDNIDLAIEKTSNGAEIYEGDEFEYTLTISNLGDTGATNVEIVDVLPPGLSYVSTVSFSSDNSIDLQTNVTGNSITYFIPRFNAGVVLTISVVVTADALNGTNSLTITNQATVSAAEEDINPANNSATDVNVINPFFIPNVITPNGDNKNDRFEIKGIGKFATNDIVIFNRYGDHVFQIENYDNNWDAPGQVAGTYYYIFRGSDRAGRMHEFKGWVQIIKD